VWQCDGRPLIGVVRTVDLLIVDPAYRRSTLYNVLTHNLHCLHKNAFHSVIWGFYRRNTTSGYAMCTYTLRLFYTPYLYTVSQKKVSQKCFHQLGILPLQYAYGLCFSLNSNGISWMRSFKSEIECRPKRTKNFEAERGDNLSSIRKNFN